MHADALPTQTARDDGWFRPVVLALVVHVLVALVFIAGWLWSPERSVEPAAGDPSMEASLDVSAADARVARQALKATPVETPPPPAPLPEPAPEDSVPPPQPIPEPRPQDAPTPQQAQAQERVAQPDKVDQDRVDALAISAEKAKQEQEAKRRQEQIDLTERKRQEEAEQKLRLAKQQEEADAKKKQAAAQQAADDAERQKKIADIPPSARAGHQGSSAGRTEVASGCCCTCAAGLRGRCDQRAADCRAGRYQHRSGRQVRCGDPAEGVGAVGAPTVGAAGPEMHDQYSSVAWRQRDGGQGRAGLPLRRGWPALDRGGRVECPAIALPRI